MILKHYLDKIGIAGSLVTAACCLGLSAVLSVVSAVGLGFLIKDAILLPLLIVFLAVTLIGLAFGYRVHRQPWALLLAGISSAALYFFIFVSTIRIAAYVAILGLVVASVLNLVLRRKCAPVCRT